MADESLSPDTSGDMEDWSDHEMWVERVVRAILLDSVRKTPSRPPNVSAKLIAYYAARPELTFELELYEERGAGTRDSRMPADAKH